MKRILEENGTHYLVLRELQEGAKQSDLVILEVITFKISHLKINFHSSSQKVTLPLITV